MSPWLTTAALLAVLTLKLTIGLSLGSHPLLTPSAVGPDLEGLDSDYYLHLAQRVNAGDVWLLDPASFFGRPAPAFFLSPLYIYVLALLLKIGGSLAFVRAAQLVLGTAAVLLAAATARRWYGARAGWIAGALMAGCGLFTFYESLILQASLDPFLTALDLYTLTRAVQDGRRRDWIAAGLALGLHTLNRPNILIAGVAVLGAALAQALIGRRTQTPQTSSVSRAPRSVLRGPVPPVSPVISMCAVLVVLAPVTIRNYRATGEFTPISSHGGLNFLIGNGPEADGTFVGVMGVPPTIRGQWVHADEVAGGSGASTFFLHRATAWIAANPGAELALVARKAWYALSNVFLTLNYSYPFYARDIGSPLGILAVGPALILALGMVGLTIARPSGDGAWILPVFSAFSVASVILFFVAARYRLPFQVALVIASGGAVSWALDRARARAWMALVIAALIASAATVVSAWPTGLDNGRSEEHVRMGLFEFERGRVVEGDRWISNALNTYGHPLPGVVHLRAGQVHEAAGRLSDALDRYRRAIAIDPEEPSLRLAAGRVLNGLGQPLEALNELGRLPDAFRPESTGREYERAAAALVLTKQEPALLMAVEAFTNAEARLPQSPSVRLNRAVALAMLGRTKEARAAAESALALDPNYTRARDFLEKIK